MQNRFGTCFLIQLADTKFVFFTVVENYGVPYLSPLIVHSIVFTCAGSAYTSAEYGTLLSQRWIANKAALQVHVSKPNYKQFIFISIWKIVTKWCSKYSAVTFSAKIRKNYQFLQVNPNGSIWTPCIILSKSILPDLFSFLC